MPGLSFVADFKNNLAARQAHILSSLTNLLHDQCWQAKTILSTAHYFLGLTSYEDYPFNCYENANYRIFVEGRIYRKSSPFISQELFELAELLFAKPHETTERCKQWLSHVDGDYLIFIIHKSSKQAWILNDILGRLPVYYSRADDSILISRDLRFISSLQARIEFDRMGIAQYLIFGYPLGMKTLLKTTYRLQPATLVSIRPAEMQILLKVLHEFNFDNKPNATHSIKKNAANLLSLFTESCKTRTHLSENPHNVVGLSGGLDSRSVAACLAANNVRFTATTRLDSSKTSVADANIAKILAETLGAKWCPIRVDTPRGADILKLLRLKSGMNPLGMVSRVQFLEKVQATYGSGITYITGDGGDKVFHNLAPTRTLKTLDELVQYTISENEIFGLQQVSSMTGISADEIKDNLKSHLSKYPETNLAEKYVHFLIFERAFKWLFEGEDRNRCYFWTVAPFYSISLFNYAMGCPAEQKKYYRLYKSFLMTLSPSIASIANANWGIPISSHISTLHLIFKSVARQVMPRMRKKIKTQQQAALPHLYVECLKRQLRDCSAIQEYVPYLTVHDIEQARGQSNAGILLSLTSAIEDLQYGQSSLSCFYDARL